VKYGQVVAAAVTLRGDATAASLRAACQAVLADFKVPREIYVVDRIPRTPTGKIQRNRIAAQLAGQGR